MDYTKTSIFISLILRHKPETIGIVLDEHGRTAQYLGGVALVLQLVVEHYLQEVAVEQCQHRLEGVILGVGGEIVDDAVAHHWVAPSDGFLQFEDIVVLADTYLVFN